MAGISMLLLYIAIIVSFLHGLIYSASHAMWTWFVIGFCFPPIAVAIGAIHFFVAFVA